MAALSSYFENLILNWVNGNTYAPPSSLHLQVWSTDPGENGVGSTGQMLAITGDSVLPTISFSVPVDGSMSNDGTMVVSESSSVATTVNYAGVYDGANPATANLLFWGQTNQPLTINIGDRVVLNSSSLIIRID